jgi:hypothetical protein
VYEEHVEDGKLDDGLVRTGADSVQGARKVPLRGAVEFGLPDHRSEDEESRYQEHWPATKFHREGNPEYVGESLGRGSMLTTFSLRVRLCQVNREECLPKASSSMHHRLPKRSKVHSPRD